MAASCYFGVDLCNQLDHNFPSRSRDGTSNSSSDLLFSLLLPYFIWTNCSKSNFPFPVSLGQIILCPMSLFLSFLGQISSSSHFASSDKLFQVRTLSSFCSSWTKYSESKSNPTKVFSDNFVSCLSLKFTPISQKTFKEFFFCLSHKFFWILHIYSETLSTSFHSRILSYTLQKYSKTSQFLVIAAYSLQFFSNNLRPFHSSY